jgi:hypothetical protein
MKELFGYIKLGRLNKNIADKIGRKPADIFIDYNHLRHIARGKYFILEKLGIDPITYVQKIVKNYTEIRKGKTGTLLLVAHLAENNKKNIAVIELQLIVKYSMYIVKTAMPRIKFAKDEIKIWEK